METASLIQQLYIAYYGRPADPNGLDYWAGRLEANGGDLGEILNAFATSDEFSDRFGSLSEQDLVNNLYEQILGRPAEAEGLAFYTNMIARGESSLIELALDITNGAQGDDITVIEKRVEVAQQFTQSVEERGLRYGADEVEAAGQVLAGVKAESDVATYVQSQVEQLLTSLAGGAVPTPGISNGGGSSGGNNGGVDNGEDNDVEAPRLNVDAEGNATVVAPPVGGNPRVDLSGFNLDNVTGTLFLETGIILPTDTAHLPASVMAGEHWVTVGSVDISSVAFLVDDISTSVRQSEPSKTIIEVAPGTNPSMTPAQFASFIIYSAGVEGTQESITFTESGVINTVATDINRFVEAYWLQGNEGSEITTGSYLTVGSQGDDTFYVDVDPEFNYQGDTEIILGRAFRIENNDFVPVAPGDTSMDFVLKQADDAYVNGQLIAGFKAQDIGPNGNDTVVIDLSQGTPFDIEILGFMLGSGEEADTMRFQLSDADITPGFDNLLNKMASIEVSGFVVDQLGGDNPQELFTFNLGLDLNSDGNADSFLSFTDVIGSNAEIMQSDVLSFGENFHSELVGIEALASRVEGVNKPSTNDETSFLLHELFSAASKDDVVFDSGDEGFVQLLGIIATNFEYEAFHLS